MWSGSLLCASLLDFISLKTPLFIAKSIPMKLQLGTKLPALKQSYQHIEQPAPLLFVEKLQSGGHSPFVPFLSELQKI